MTSGVHWIEDEVDHGTHDLASRVADVPVLGTLAEGAADAVTFATQVDGGVIGGATSLLGGVANAVVHPIDTARGLETMAEHLPGPVGQSLRLGHGLIDMATGDASLGDVADRAFNPLAEARENERYWGNVGSALLNPYRQSFEQGRYGEIVGRGAFDIGLLLSGAGEAEAAGTAGTAGRVGELAEASRVAETADVARVADAADAARIAETADGARVAETADAARAADAADGARAADAADGLRPAESGITEGASGHAGGGGFVDSIDPAAEAAYDGIRANPGDVANVAENTRLPPEVVQRIKDHLFNNEHTLTTVEGEAAEQSRFVAIQDYADLWRGAEGGTLTAEQTEQLMNLMTHENVEARLAESGLNILEPVDPVAGMRPFRAQGAHDLASIAERNFDPRLFDRIPPEVRSQYLRTMVEGTMDVRGTFSPEALQAMPPEVQEMAAQIARERAAMPVPPPGGVP
ncbi:MAG TPA: hypothetical protein VHT91_25175 [Kofleriaceae bacterium]|nr:hypothetical protein [Kofleriaceae bacterium]